MGFGLARSAAYGMYLISLTAGSLRRRLSTILAFGAVFLTGAASAHDPGLSSANVIVQSNSVDVELTFNERDFAGIAGTTVEELRSGNAKTQLETAARRALSIRVADNALTPVSVTSGPEGENNVALRYKFDLPVAAADLQFESLLLSEMSFGHRQAFAAVNGRGEEITRSILSARENRASFPVSLSGGDHPSSRGRFGEFFLLGVHHIVTGYDHLLFLFGLLIVCRTRGSALLLITCFTVAHSITLALATFGLVDLPGGLVEAVIAASIVYVGIENLMGRESLMRWRWLITLSFGLIHGLGFAGILADLGIAEQGMNAVVPLLAFNCGVEAGQLAIAAIALPIIWKLRDRPGFIRVAIPACSLLIAAAGAYWLVERTLFA